MGDPDQILHDLDDPLANPDWLGIGSRLGT